MAHTHDNADTLQRFASLKRRAEEMSRALAIEEGKSTASKSLLRASLASLRKLGAKGENARAIVQSARDKQREHERRSRVALERVETLRVELERALESTGDSARTGIEQGVSGRA